MSKPEFVAWSEDGQSLVVNDVTIPVQSIEGFHEWYSSLTGRAGVHVQGTRFGFLVDEDYAHRRAWLRRELSELPWCSDWEKGWLESSPMGLPSLPVLALAYGGITALIVACAVAQFGDLVLLSAVLGAWFVGRLRACVAILPTGIRVGPIWDREFGWHEVKACGLDQDGLGVQLWIMTDTGKRSASVPPVLIPVVRARLKRLRWSGLFRGDGRARPMVYGGANTHECLAMGTIGSNRHPRPWSGGGVVCRRARLGRDLGRRPGCCRCRGACLWLGAGSIVWLAVLAMVGVGVSWAGSTAWLIPKGTRFPCVPVVAEEAHISADVQSLVPRCPRTHGDPCAHTPHKRRPESPYQACPIGKRIRLLVYFWPRRHPKLLGDGRLCRGGPKDPPLPGALSRAFLPSACSHVG